jgi:transcription-repair coupling factor (superfamily II helicase)
VVASKEGEEQRIREIIGEDKTLKRIQPRYLRGTPNEGFRLTFRDGAKLDWAASDAGLVIVTETEIFGRQRQRRPSINVRAVAQRAQIDQLLDFSELVEGDFVVHLQHGIALYRGLTKLDTAQGIREVISLEFDDHVTLHVPLQESHLISRYVGLSKARPQLGRIGSGRWEKSRAAAERATVDLAAELLRIQAAREAQPGHAFPPDTAWQKEFEAAFPYNETRDQLRAIAETKADLERTRPMDRLICGDVGFGKTEVAIRAAFKAVQGGRAGGRARAHDGPSPAAPEHLPRADGRLSDRRGNARAASARLAEAKKILERRRQRTGGHRYRHAPTSADGRGVQGTRTRDHRRGAALRREAQGAVQARCAPRSTCSR